METRRRRQLLRGRAFLVRQRTAVNNRVHGHLTAENHGCPVTDLYGKAGRAWLTTVPLSPMLGAQRDGLLRVHDFLTTEIQQPDRDVKRMARADPIARQLSTIPGVGVFGGLFLHAEIGPITRFRSAHHFAANGGLVPHWLKWIMVEIVQTLKLAPGPVGDYSRSLLRAKGKPKATVAAARKLSCYIYWMLREGWTYDEWLAQHQHAGRMARWSEVRLAQRMGALV